MIKLDDFEVSNINERFLQYLANWSLQSCELQIIRNNSIFEFKNLYVGMMSEQYLQIFLHFKDQK